MLVTTHTDLNPEPEPGERLGLRIGDFVIGATVVECDANGTVTLELPDSEVMRSGPSYSVPGPWPETELGSADATVLWVATDD